MEEQPAKEIWDANLSAAKGDIASAIIRTRKAILGNDIMMELFAENMLMNLWREELRKREIQ